MPRKTVRNVSAASSEEGKVGRPDIDNLAAAEEVRADEGVGEKDAPPAGENKPQDIRKRCPHGRLFQCRQCDSTKGKLTPEEEARKRVKLEDTVGQVYNAVFNLAAVITGEDSLRLSKEERHALETTGASTVEEVAPAVSLPILAAVGHAATLAGMVTGKVLDLPKEREKKKVAGVGKVLDAKGENGAQHPAPDSGGEKVGENDPRPPLFRLKTT